jgi:hypothetical protein
LAQPKGRPTPKRSDARAARRKPVVAARGTKQSNTALRASMREAMRTGDERNYPPIAAGPERALVRDAVDDRRSFGWLAIPGWLVAVVLTLVPAAAVRAVGSLVFPLLIGVIVADALAARRAVGRALDERWPDGTQASRRSLLWYGTARNMQFRRQRLPRPRTWHGEPVPPPDAA